MFYKTAKAASKKKTALQFKSLLNKTSDY